jgi:CheY-like chemotaxis protein
MGIIKMPRGGFMMPGAKVTLLIVDDEPSIALALCHILIESGYCVRAAEDGFSALAKIRQEIPDILLSDLNMPGMSGLELLSVVRRRFPAVQAIAMSGAFSGDTVPPGVCADAFYAKGTHPESLLQLLATMTNSERRPSHPHRNTPATIWIPSNGHDPSGDAYVMITCPECLRTFPRVLNEPINAIDDAICVHCYSSIQYGIVQPMVPASTPAFQQEPDGREWLSVQPISTKEGWKKELSRCEK